MRFDSTVKKFEVGFVVAVAAAVVLELALVFSASFTEDSHIGPSYTSKGSTKDATPVGTDAYPALPEPALRTLDGVVYHG